MQRLVMSGLTVFAILCLVAPLTAQTKTQKCGNIGAIVDVNDGGGWSNGALELALLKDGGGWVIASGPDRGKNCPAKKGQKLRFNFNDGADHMVNVKPSSTSANVSVRSGSRPAIVLVDVSGAGATAAVHFEITGSPNPKAKTDGCPGGNFYLEIE